MALELRQSTQQIVRVGVILTKQVKLTTPLNPISGAQLSWYFWHYIIKADGVVKDIVANTWADIVNCAGCYFLTLTVADTSVLGPLVLYIYDTNIGRPIFKEFSIINKNSYDAKYNLNDLPVVYSESQHARQG